ncbi:hypothetical protein F5B20DRAFT_540353 [Whalleya microplaca]|nr:hypothetical protein F5B20DRAFT_540353 [Whalleya microplaca]
MSVGFGFSAGDFLAALKLTGTVIDCLCESSASSASYRELLNELYALESALLRVKRLDLDEDQKVEKIALRQAAAQCQRTIDDFWGTIQKYHPNLQEGGSSSRLRDGWVKVKWVLLKKEDLEKFKRDIAAHTNSITILLLTTQFEATNMQGRRAENQQITLAGRIQDASNQCMNRLASLVSSMNENVKQGKKLLETTASVVQTNLRVFQMVFDIHQFILQIPHQVHRQQPVYMIDAFGKESPFHLEFVRSAEALVSILRCNFSVVPSGQRLIESGNFVIQDCGTQRDIDLSSSWELCFSPGQRVMMSVILTNNGESCPNCSARLLLQGTQEQTCQRCGTTLMLKDREPLKTQLSELWEPRLPSSFEFTLGRAPDSNRLKRKRESSEILDTSKFRRIRMMNPRFKTHRCKVYKHENNDWLDQGTGRATVQLYNVSYMLRHDILRLVYSHTALVPNSSLLLYLLVLME